MGTLKIYKIQPFIFICHKDLFHIPSCPCFVPFHDYVKNIFQNPLQWTDGPLKKGLFQ